MSSGKENKNLDDLPIAFPFPPPRKRHLVLLLACETVSAGVYVDCRLLQIKEIYTQRAKTNKLKAFCPAYHAKENDDEEGACHFVLIKL